MRKFRSLSIFFFAALFLAVVFPVQADFGTNWTGTFYNSNNLTGTSVSIPLSNGINFNWGTGSVTQSGVALSNCSDAQNNPATISADCSNFFSARFTSTQTFAPGIYRFVVSSDDGVRVYINGYLLLDRWSTGTNEEFTTTITSGLANITVEYFENTDIASIQVEWFLESVPDCKSPLTMPSSVRNNLDHNAADWGAYCEGSPIPQMQNVVTPSIDGKSLECGISGGAPYSNVHCYRNLVSEPSAAMFTMDMAFWFTPTTCNNAGGSTSVVQALEFTMNKWYQEKRYEFAI